MFKKPPGKTSLLIILSVFFIGLALAYKVQRVKRQFTHIKNLSVIKSPGVPSLTVKIISSIPHGRTAFTEGLEWHGGVLYECSGKKGKSFLRKIDPRTGEVIKYVKTEHRCFAEGITIFHGKLYQLTWKSHKCFVYDADTLEKRGEFTYSGEGWGLTHNTEHLIMSDGSDRLRFIDPEDFKTVRTLKVRLNGRMIHNINELEFIEGAVYANVYFTNTILRIDPSDGRVTGLIDFRPLYAAMSAFSLSGINVPNGIAYNPVKRELYVTGKFWPSLFKVEIVPE